MARDARLPFERFGMPRTKRVREAQLFPLFLKLRNRPCLVVGAGRVGESKIAGLLAAGAKLRVVAPQATPKVESWARSRKVQWLQREFRAEDLRGILLVVAATSSRDLHQKIDRKSTRLNSSHGYISYAVFCLKKKKQETYKRHKNAWPGTARDRTGQSA